MERCWREIAAIEAEIRAGNPELQGLCLALSDWHAELRILQKRNGSMRIQSRIEKLEDEMLPLPAGPPLLLNINAVDSEGKVVSTTVFEVPQAPPSTRRWRRFRGYAPKGDW